MKEVSMWTITKNKEWSLLEQEFDWVKKMSVTPQDPVHHAEGNVAVHTQMVLAALEAMEQYQSLDEALKEILRAAALMHDMEKYNTTIINPDGSISSPGHAKRGAQTARVLLYTELNAPFHIREQVVGLVRYHGLPLWLLERPDPLRTLVRAAYEVDTRRLAILARADVLGRICADQADLLYRIDCFEEFCKEYDCWGTVRRFENANAKMHYLLHEDSHIDYIPFEEPVAEVILMSGLPGAGKDTWIRKHCADWPLVSLDGIRNKWKVAPDDKTANGRVIQEAKEQAKVFLRRGQGFVWNATNTTRQMRTQLIELFMTYKAKVRIVYLEPPYSALVKQNKNREAVVPQRVIDKLIGKLEVPAGWEAHTVSFINVEELA
ncbi:MAG: AAA family ATPase [Pseudobacter sp.]|uniref:AAA family ATPase n=1 Tax=Pseudobacter sp. TaxID=2045420 RepID=UPI003F7FBD75